MSARSANDPAERSPISGESTGVGKDSFSLPADFDAGRRRLLQAVEQVPLRYAPFWDRVAELWNVSVGEVERTLASSVNAAHWRRAWPGFRYMDVGDSVPSRGRSRLLEFAPGFRFPRHVHEGHELVCVLSGSYVDSQGLRVSAGDVQHMEPGSVHALTVEARDACLVAVRQPGIRFTEPLLKYLNRWLR